MGQAVSVIFSISHFLFTSPHLFGRKRPTTRFRIFS
jgi:hypothetical protein